MPVRIRAGGVVVAAMLALGAGPAADFTTALDAAMTPYYGALVSSARGDAESTQRHLVIFVARWADAVKAEASAPAALTGDPEWRPTLDRIDTFARRAQALVRAHNLHDAHRALEGIRLALFAIRTRHGVETPDDRLTAYHESMERIETRASMYNEILLRDADYGEMAQDLARARALWSKVAGESGALAADEAWTDAARRSVAAQDDLARLIDARDDAALARAADAMKNAYLDLLAVLAHAPR